MLKLLNEFLAVETMSYFREELSDKYSSGDEELTKYIDKLHSIIKDQRKALRNLCKRIKKYKKGISFNNVSVQTVVQTDTEVVKEKQVDGDSWRKESISVEEMVKEAAEDAMKQTGFVYHEASGLYYDYNTGYYYNAELSLYYDTRTGIYYYYDKEKNEFQFHSQVSIPETVPVEQPAEDSSDNTATKKRKPKKATKIETHKKLKTEKECDIEEGECSDDSSTQASDVSSPEYDSCDGQKQNREADQSKKEQELDEFTKAWPPCMRIIVKETSVKNLKIGKLFMVTCAGATLGREGDHLILIPDINISKYHAKFAFDNINEEKEIGNYTLTDLGSRNGTFVDGNRLSTALQESEAQIINHNTTIRVGSTTLLCHIHPGRETCSDCEPGLLIEDEERKAYIPEENLTEKRKKQLQKLKQKFGLTISEETQSHSANYKDRAEIRRQTVGSDSDCFKTEVALVTQPIKKTNKGFKMLAKMGWNEGEALGSKSEDAIKEPILVQQRGEKVGLGYDGPAKQEVPEVMKKKQELWTKVQARYKSLDEETS